MHCKVLIGNLGGEGFPDQISLGSPFPKGMSRLSEMLGSGNLLYLCSDLIHLCSFNTLDLPGLP